MGHFPLDCDCICHDMIKTLALYSDMTIDETVTLIKLSQVKLQKDPIAYEMAKSDYQLGVGMRALEKMKRDVELR
jgi:hypothetical protein